MTSVYIPASFGFQTLAINLFKKIFHIKNYCIYGTPGRYIVIHCRDSWSTMMMMMIVLSTILIVVDMMNEFL